MATIIIGCDIGQKRDPTAIAVVELEWRRDGPRRDDHYLTRYLERLPLGTSYPDVVTRLAGVVSGLLTRPRPLLSPAHELTLYVDATGVGQPVVDMLVAVGVRPRAVYFTHGDKRTVDGHEIKLGKAWLVSRMQALLQTTRLHLPDTSEARQLAKELQDYEIKVDTNANDTYGAFKVGTHDDLVTALGLAVQGPGVSKKLVSW